MEDIMPTEIVFHEPSEVESREWLAFQTAINWCHGTIVQGNRVLSLNFPEMKQDFSPVDMVEYRRQIELWQVYRLIDEHFFLNAARQVIRWCERAKKQYPELIPSLDKFCSDGNIINTRDMREHNDDYLDGRGRRQEDYVTEVDSTNCPFPGDQNGTCDASSTVVFGCQYLIGGRVDVRQTLEKVNFLLGVLVPFMNQKWPWTAHPRG
jgi:hypothetical protein